MLKWRGIGARVLLPLAAIGLAAILVTTLMTTLATGRMTDDARELETRRAAERVQTTEQTSGKALRAIADDYAHWGEMVDFVQQPTLGFMRDNFAVETLDTINADAIAVFDADGAAVVAAMSESGARRWGLEGPLSPAFDAPSRLVAMPQALQQVLVASDAARQAIRDESTALGWTPTDTHWLQIGAAAIGPYLGEHRRDGLVVFVRVLDAERMAERFRDAQARYRIVPLHEPPIAQVDGFDVTLLDPQLGPQARAVGTHAFELDAAFAQLRWFAIAQQAAVLLVALLAIAVLVERRVVRRVDRLRIGVDALRNGRRKTLLLPGPDDELRALGEEFQRLYTSLEQAQSAWRGAALTDVLTGLPNRAALLRDLTDRSSEQGKACALFLIDLDGFKHVNDQFGHAVGDDCLRRVATAIRERAAADIRVYRLGGDEFAATGRGDAVTTAGTLVEAVAGAAAADPVRCGRIAASIGWVALERHADPSDALASADMAMYEAKRAGGGRAVGYDEAMGVRRRERLSLEDRLVSALARGEIRTVYQPVVDARSGALLAVEALARWHDPERGQVPPSRFVELAEAIGLVARLDLDVLRQGLETLRALSAAAPDCRLQVNLSPRSLVSPGIVEAVAAACRDASVDPGRVTIEITESAFASDAGTPTMALAALRQVGVAIALDDFGVGHSSLSRLARFAPDALKIDGQFVRDYTGTGGLIVETVLDLASRFGIRTTAEFVETDAQRRFLAERGCDALQGYAIAAPMPLAALLEWIRARRH